MEYKRICPNCQKEIQYKSYSAWYNANKAQSCCRNCSYKKSASRCANLSRLLEDTPEAFYWVGFLLADGSFCNGRLSLTLKKSDSEQVHRFGKYIEYSGSYGTSPTSESIKCKDIDVINQLCKKFEIHQSKTYNPPSTILKFDKTLVYSLLAGFIDGDGRIANQTNRNDFFLSIKNHSSWISILKEFNTLICQENFCKIDSQGYAVLTITNTKYLKELKRKILDLNLPILNRKRDIIDLSFTSKYVKANQTKQKVAELYNKGMRNKDIAHTLGVSPATVTKYTKILK